MCFLIVFIVTVCCEEPDPDMFIQQHHAYKGSGYNSKFLTVRVYLFIAHLNMSKVCKFDWGISYNRTLKISMILVVLFLYCTLISYLSYYHCSLWQSI